MQDQRPISFVGTTTSDSETEKVVQFDHPGTLTHLKVVTHKGQQYALQHHAKIVRNGSETTLFRSLDKEFIAGNGQVFDVPIRFEFKEGDELVLRAENVNTSGYDYHHNMTINVDRETGVFERIASGLQGVI
jgi:hypothetical protein